MQTRDQVQAKVASMFADLGTKLVEEVDRLYASGAVNPSEYDNNYVLPKALYTVALHNIAESYGPLPSDRPWRKLVSDLKRF